MGEIFSKDGIINIFLGNANNVIWSYFLIWALILCGLWFTWKTHFVQFRMAGEMIRLLADSAGAKQKEKHISSFQAFSVSIATRVGTGNLAGVVQIGGGTLGATMMNGIKRGLFSNEAGEGSAPHAAATALCTHPVKQGLIQALGVFTDTLLVCSCTAFIILISGLYTDTSLKGIGLTQAAMKAEVGQAGTIFVALAILLFAWSSIIGNDYYGESNIRFLTSNKTALQLFRVASTGVMVMFGAAASLDLVWSLGDICMALITIVNLTAILFLAKYVFRCLDDYMSQKRKGIKEPVFHADGLPEIKDDLEAWK